LEKRLDETADDAGGSRHCTGTTAEIGGCRADS
jgi:hypothetical protein